MFHYSQEVPRASGSQRQGRQETAARKATEAEARETATQEEGRTQGEKYNAVSS